MLDNMEQFEKLRKKHLTKLKIYKYLAMFVSVAAVLCIIVGIIIGYKFLPFLGILLISVGLPLLITPLVKGF